MATFAPPANKLTIQAAPITGGTIGTYASAGSVEQVTAWPGRMTESEAILIHGDATRTQVEHPTHFTLGTFEAILMWGDASFGVNKGLDDLDGTTTRKKEVALKITMPDVDPAGTDPYCVIKGYYKYVDPEPWNDGTGTLKYKIIFQATEAPTWTGLPT